MGGKLFVWWLGLCLGSGRDSSPLVLTLPDPLLFFMQLEKVVPLKSFGGKGFEKLFVWKRRTSKQAINR